MKCLFQVCESIEQEGEVPEQWAKSYTIPLYKGKGDVLMVDKHRGVILLEQDMKVYEKTLECSECMSILCWILVLKAVSARQFFAGC